MVCLRFGWWLGVIDGWLLGVIDGESDGLTRACVVRAGWGCAGLDDDEQPAAASAASAIRPARDRLTVDDMNVFPHSCLP